MAPHSNQHELPPLDPGVPEIASSAPNEPHGIANSGMPAAAALTCCAALTVAGADGEATAQAEGASEATDSELPLAAANGAMTRVTLTGAAAEADASAAGADPILGLAAALPRPRPREAADVGFLGAILARPN